MVKKMNKVWAFFYKDTIKIPGVDHKMSLAEVGFTVAGLAVVGYAAASKLVVQCLEEINLVVVLHVNLLKEGMTK